MKYAAACCLLFFSLPSYAEKPRVIVLTDITNEPDDEQSMVRFLCYTNEFDTEALIATTSIWLRDRTAPDQILKRIDAYGKVRPNLLKHSTGWPTREHLLDIVSTGVAKWGMNGVGPGNDSEGSRRIIDVVDAEDPRPVYVSIWGGANCLAQALWHVNQTRSSAEVDKFVSKLRVYTISDQDDAGPWMRKTFPNLFYIVSPGYEERDGGGYHYATWVGISGDKFHGRFPGADFAIVDNPWLDKHIRQQHGPLGTLHPQTKYLMEGDTPSFFWLIPNGLNVPEHPNYGGWGGRYELYTPPQRKWHYQQVPRPIWTDAYDEVIGVDGTTYRTNQATIWRWREAYQHDFAARIDWSNSPRFDEANHPPQIVLLVNRKYQPPTNNGKTRFDFLHPIELTAKSGETLDLDAHQSTDPDGDRLDFAWFQYREAGSFDGTVEISNATTAKAQLTVPKVSSPKSIHVVLQVRDSGSPQLYAYRRIVVNVTPESTKDERHRVFVTTDVADGTGDPDDRQSLCHLLYYADELDIRGIAPDRFSDAGQRACEAAIEHYRRDFNSPWTRYRELGYPTPDEVGQYFETTREGAVQRLVAEANKADQRPLYVLAWGNLRLVAEALDRDPTIAKRIRLLSIGTNLRAKVDSGDGSLANWNGGGRKDVFDKYPEIWWIESDWTYNGMFKGPEAVAIKDYLNAHGGELGQHIKQVIDTVDWADYFRAGDTPTLLYLLDPTHDAEDPETASWAGRFARPFPKERPHYWTGIDGGVEWNYDNPKLTWQNADTVFDARTATLLNERGRMYEALRAKIDRLYGVGYEYDYRKAN